MTHTYEIKGMTCGSCVARVKGELLKLGDVTSADVQLNAPQAVISMNRHIATGTLQQAVSKAGNYTLSELNGYHPSAAMPQDDETETTGSSYYPIFLIFGYIFVATGLLQIISGGFVAETWMSHFMGGFFLVFSFFKLLNIKGFAEGYSTYDIVAKSFPVWGFIYPFIELLLGLLYLTGLFRTGTNIVTFIVMGISSIGVINSLRSKSPIQCACLGTVIKLPLGKVTLFEDILMVVMSGVMIMI